LAFSLNFFQRWRRIAEDFFRVVLRRVEFFHLVAGGPVFGIELAFFRFERIYFRQRVFAVVAFFIEVFFRRLVKRDVGAKRFIIIGLVFRIFLPIYCQ
jgi:hypothetical protein